MPAPLLVLLATQNGQSGALLSLDPSLQGKSPQTAVTPFGYSRTLQFLANGATPGVLEPGESETVPVYYGGWLTSQWDTSGPAPTFSLGVLTADSTAVVIWSWMQAGLKPAGMPDTAWNGIFPNLTAHLGKTWGSVVQTLDQDASYLASLGETVSDYSQLWSFEIQMANGLGPVKALSTVVDTSVPAPGLPLTIQRTFSATIAPRNLDGPFGYGWALGGGWGQALVVQSDGTLTVTNADGSQRSFQPASAGGYSAQPGDYGTLAKIGNRLFTLTEKNGLVTQFQSSQVAYIQDANGNRITAGYQDTSGNAVPVGKAYDVLASLTDSSGGWIHFAGDSAGRITAISNSLGQTTQYTYDCSHQFLLSVTDFAGRTTGYTYSTGTGSATQNALLSITNPDGTQRDFSYDAQGRLSKVALNGGAEATQYTYGTFGTVTAADANGGDATYSFNKLGLVAKLVDPLQHTSSYAYDSFGNLVQATDAAGQSVSYIYDSQGNLVQSTDPRGDVTKFSYGPLDRLTSLTDPNGNQTQYQHDQNGDLVSTTYADGTVERNAFNPIGELLQSTDGNGNVVHYSYNSAGQLLSKTYADGSQTTYAYDAGGKLTSAANATGTTNLTYDSANHLTEIAYPDGKSLQYSYDAAGRRSQMVDQSGSTVNYTYNSLGQFSGLTDGSGNSLVSYTYDATGRLSRETKGNRTYTAYTYDAAGDVLSVLNYAPGGAINSSFVYTYNDLGLQTSETTLDGQWTYSYDAIGQLTHAVFASNNPGAIPNQDLQYFYDAAGNRTKTIINGVTTTYSTNNRNEYSQVGSTSYAYDPNGSLVSQTDGSGTTTFTYNVDNRLSGIRPATGSPWSYQYDPLGNLYSTTQSGQTTQYLIDPSGLGNVVGTYNAGGNLIANYTYGLGLVSQVNTSGVTNYYDFDALGSTADLTNAAGGIVNTYSYLPFGGALTTSGTSAHNAIL